MKVNLILIKKIINKIKPWVRKKVNLILIKRIKPWVIKKAGPLLKRRPVRKEIAFLSCFGLLAVLLLFYFAIFSKLSGKLGDLSKRRVELQVAIMEAEKLIANKGKFLREIELAEEKIKFYRRRLPSEREVYKLFENLSKRAEESGIKFTSVGKEIPQEGTVYTRYATNYKIESGYHQLGRFVSELENMDRLAKIEDIRIRANPKDRLRHNIELVVSTFVFKEL